jgi:hypothetical protein
MKTARVQCDIRANNQVDYRYCHSKPVLFVRQMAPCSSVSKWRTVVSWFLTPVESVTNSTIKFATAVGYVADHAFDGQLRNAMKCAEFDDAYRIRKLWKAIVLPTVYIIFCTPPAHPPGDWPSCAPFFGCFGPVLAGIRSVGA